MRAWREWVWAPALIAGSMVLPGLTALGVIR